MFENPRRGRQARNFTKNVPKILDLKSSSEQIFSENWRWCPCSFAFWTFFCFLSESIDCERKTLYFEGRTWNRGRCRDIHTYIHFTYTFTSKNLKWGWLRAQVTQPGLVRDLNGHFRKRENCGLGREKTKEGERKGGLVWNSRNSVYSYFYRGTQRKKT